MLTKRADVDAISAEVTRSVVREHILRNPRQPLISACELYNPQLVKHLLAQVDAQGKLLYSKEIKNAFKKLVRLPGIALDNETARNRELCLRLILRARIKQLKEQNPKLSDAQLAAQIFGKKINPIVGLVSIRRTFLMNSSVMDAVRPISTIIDELDASIDIQAIEFDKYEVSGDIPMTFAGKVLRVSMLEVYLREYHKLKYEGKDNPTLYAEIINYFKSDSYLFPRKMREFPEQLANALGNAEKDLRAKHGDNFDTAKLKRVTNGFEAKFIPDAYEIQLNTRKNIRNWLIGVSIVLSFTIFVPVIAWISYSRFLNNEPISANHTSLKAYAAYVTNVNKENKDDNREKWLQNEPTKEDILERVATKEPVKKITVEGQKPQWRTHKVVRVSEDDKVTVFSTRYNAQAKKFDEAIKEAEKEVETKPTI